MIMNYMQNYECKNGIFLEPRLQEYLKKKAYYKKNKIHNDVSLEQEFGITKEDVKRLKAFTAGDNDLYNYKTQDKFADSEWQQSFEFDFDPDEAYRSDPRYHRYVKKMIRDKQDIAKIHNYDHMNDPFKPITDFFDKNDYNYNDDYLQDDYDYDSNYNNHNYDSYSNNNYYDDRNLTIGENSKKYNDNKYLNKPIKKSSRIYSNDLPHYTPEIDFKNKMYPMKQNRPQQLPIDHDPRIDQIIGELDSYNHKINKSYERISEMDTEHKLVIPNVSCNGKRSNPSTYKPVPFMTRGEGVRDYSVHEGLPTRSAKSYGYHNPIEHYYDYISDDIQNPNHVVFEPGEATRLNNRKPARPYKRDIY